VQKIEIDFISKYLKNWKDYSTENNLYFDILYHIWIYTVVNKEIFHEFENLAKN